MQVRPATEEDVDVIAAILEAAFLREGEAQLFRTLWGSESLATALVAIGGDIDGEAVAGVVVLSHLQAPRNCLGLGPIAVSEEHRGLGAGRKLIGASIGWAREHGHDGIFVVGRSRFYTRFGFSLEAARPFVSPYPPDFLLALELAGGKLPEGGDLRYPPAFAALT